jgi:hypothetical protein
MSRRLALQGASEEDTTRMREMLRHSASALNASWTLHDDSDADLIVVDIDSVHGHMDWLRVQSGGRPVAALTQNPRFDDADMILRKPIKPDDLAAILNEVDAHSPMRTYAEPPTPVVAPPAPVAQPSPAAAAPVTPPAPAVIEVTPPPATDRRLSDWLADGALAQAVRLTMGDAPELVLDPGNKTYYADGTARVLTPYFKRAITLEEWQPVEYAALAALQSSGKGQPYSRLLWLFHALGSNGRLVPDLDVDAKYKLSRWPQIEREFPKHFRIATVMMKQPATLTEIADQSGANLADVIDFTNAYNATGHIEMEPVVAAPVTRDSGRHAILSRLRNPFGAS